MKMWENLELSGLRRAREGNHVADILHTGYEKHQAFEAETETGVRTRAVFADIEVPPNVFVRNSHFLGASHECIVVFFTNRTTDDFTDLREEHIGALHRFAVFVGLHVERLDFLRVINHDHRLLEVLFHEIAFVFGSQVAAPVYGELKLFALGNGFFEQTNTFCVRQTHEFGVDHGVQAIEQGFVDHIIEEFEVLSAVFECPTYAVLDEVFFEIHQLREVHKGNFRLNHPELRKVARGVRVFGAEGRTEGVDRTECCGTEFAFELSRYGQARALTEEVVGIVDLSFVIFAQIIEILRRYLEHLSGTFAVTGRNDRAVEIAEAVFVEVGVNGHRHLMANAEDGTESVGAQTQMGVLTHVFKRLSFLLHGVIAAASTVDFDLCGLDFGGLSRALTFHQRTFYAKASTGGDEFEQFAVKLLNVGHNLHVLDGRSVVEGDETYAFTAATGAYPAFNADFCSEIGAL